MYSLFPHFIFAQESAPPGGLGAREGLFLPGLVPFTSDAKNSQHSRPHGHAFPLLTSFILSLLLPATPYVAHPRCPPSPVLYRQAPYQGKRFRNPLHGEHTFPYEHVLFFRLGGIYSVLMLLLIVDLNHFPKGHASPFFWFPTIP